MRLNPEKIDSLIEAQYHYFESGQPEQAATVVDMLMKPLYDLGRYPELLSIVEKTIETVEEPDSRFYIFQARALMALGRPDEALSTLELTQYELGEDQELRAAILIDKGASLRRLGEFSRAGEIIDDYQQAFGIYNELINTVKSEEDRKMFRGNQGTCRFGEGTIYQYFLEDPNRAMEEYAIARNIFEEVDLSDGIADATKQMGEIFASPQFPAFYNPERANVFLQQALEIHRQNNYQKSVLETLYQLGRLHRDEPEQALRFFTEYLELAQSLGLIREQAVGKRHLVDIRFEIEIHKPIDERDFSPIGEMLLDAISVLRLFTYDIWSRRALVNCYYLYGELLMFLGDNPTALLAFREGLRLSREPIFEGRQEGDVRRSLRLALKNADVLFRMDEPFDAEAILTNHVSYFSQLQLPVPSDQKQVHELITRLTKGE